MSPLRPQGVQIEKAREPSAAAPALEQESRQDRGLLADQDVQRAIWTNRARWFTGMSMIVDFSTGLLALIVGGKREDDIVYAFFE